MFKIFMAFRLFFIFWNFCFIFPGKTSRFRIRWRTNIIAQESSNLRAIDRYLKQINTKKQNPGKVLKLLSTKIVWIEVFFQICININESKINSGGWRRITDELDLRGGTDLVIECGDFSKCYLAAQDNGRFVVGARHFTPGEPPCPEEILSLIKTPDDTKMRYCILAKNYIWVIQYF